MSEINNTFMQSLKYDLPSYFDTYFNYKYKFKDLFVTRALEEHAAISKAFPNLDFYTVVRIKSLSSAIDKLKTKGIENVYDIHGVKHVLRGVESSFCYDVQKFLEDDFFPSSNIRINSKRTKDYISNPKPSHYQAIHESLDDGERKYEVQIKTEIMEKIARYGEASHANVYKPRTIDKYPTTYIPEYMIISGSQIRKLTFEEAFQYFYNVNYDEYLKSLQQKDRS